jgi:hypothetical protein
VFLILEAGAALLLGTLLSYAVAATRSSPTTFASARTSEVLSDVAASWETCRHIAQHVQFGGDVEEAADK